MKHLGRNRENRNEFCTQTALHLPLSFPLKIAKLEMVKETLLVCFMQEK